MENNNLTIWQKLSRYFGPHGLSNQDYPVYSFDKKELLRTTSKAEFEKEKLQAQQTWYLSGQWAKVEHNMYSQAVYYEPTRLSSVYDYESMEYTPEISAALDIYAEESTSTNEDGHILSIFSESSRIQSILTDLFVNVLDINTNLTMWTRNTCKYGDNFVYLKLDPEKGIVGCHQLPNIEIQRIEPGSSEKSPLYLEKSEPTKSLHFRWTNRNMEFQPWEIAHFRLLGDDRKLPYGTCLKYDTKIDTEYGIKEIKDIQKGDLVWSFDLKTQKRELSKVLDVVNSGVKPCFKLHTKHNFVEASNEHKILIFENGDFVYKNVLDIRVGDVLIINPNRLSDEYVLEPIVKIIDVGEFETHDIYVENENHNFYANGIVVHNSMLEKARRTWKQLLLAEDAMLIYRTSRAPERRVFKVFVGNMDDNDVEAYVQRVANKFKREQIVDSKTGNVDLRYNQMAVDQDYFIPVRDPAAPNPIETLAGACISLDTKIPLLDGRTLSLSDIIQEWDSGVRGLWVYSCNPETGDVAPGLITWAGVTRKNADVIKITLDNGKTVISTPDHKFVHRYYGFIEAKDLKVGDSLMPFYSKKEDISNTKKVWSINEHRWIDFKSESNKKLTKITKNSKRKRKFKIVEKLHNHKITNIEILNEKLDTGTITVDGNEIFHNYHTFAIESGIFIKNSNLGEIADIEYIQKKMVTALRIPKAFLGFEEAVGDGKTLALQDIRFARTINRIQKSMIAELNKIAIVHLYLLGFEDELTNFTLTLTNPSTQADLLKIDIWKEKMLLYKDATADPGSGIQPVSATWAKKHIFGFSDEEIRIDLQQQRIERAVGEELKATPLIIKKTGLFDNLDKLYGSTSGATTAQQTTETPPTGGLPEMGGGELGGLPEMPPPAGGETPQPEVTAENRFNSLNLLIENDILKGAKHIDFGQGVKSLMEIEKDVDKIISSGELPNH